MNPHDMVLHEASCHNILWYFEEPLRIPNMKQPEVLLMVLNGTISSRSVVSINEHTININSLLLVYFLYRQFFSIPTMTFCAHK